MNIDNETLIKIRSLLDDIISSYDEEVIAYQCAKEIEELLEDK